MTNTFRISIRAANAALKRRSTRSRWIALASKSLYRVAFSSRYMYERYTCPVARVMPISQVRLLE